MPSFDPRLYRDPRPLPWLIRLLGPVNRHLILPRVLRLARFDLPAADQARLAAAVHPGTAAFLGPAHPEFMTDWMIDKELSARVSPLMAHWAAWEIVNVGPLAQAFWLANNLIATVPGGGGREYSVRWAIAGHGVLLHPEGTVSWHVDRVGPLLPGIVEMAWETCRRLAQRSDPRPVVLVPIVWRLCFGRDVSAALVREIDHLAGALGMPLPADRALERRFFDLQKHLLLRGVARLGIAAPRVHAGLEAPGYFAAQEEVQWAILRRLAERYGPQEGELGRRLHTLRRHVRERAEHDPDGARADRVLVAELTRLHGFPRAVYGGGTLAQEHIAENLKRARALLLTRGWRETLHNLVPVAVAPRAAHVRVAEPVRVDPVFRDGLSGHEADAVRAELLATHHQRLQAAAAALAREVAAEVDPFRRPNPMAAAEAVG